MRNAGSRFRGIIRLVGRLGRSHPRLALNIADFIGGMSAPFRRHDSSKLERIFPELGRSGAKRLMRHILATEMRNQVIGSMGSLTPITRSFEEALLALERPVILATFHAGPILAVRDLLQRLPEGQRYVIMPAADVSGRARSVVEAVRVLNANGLVAAAIDVRTAATMAVPFLGETVQLSRGAFALSRISGAPLVPVLFVWRGYETRLVCGDRIHPLPRGTNPEDDLHADRELAQAAARWIENYFRQHPSDLGLKAASPAPRKRA